MSTMILFIHSNTTLKPRSISPSILSGIMDPNMANSASMKFSSAHQNHGSKYTIMKRKLWEIIEKQRQWKERYGFTYGRS